MHAQSTTELPVSSRRHAPFARLTSARLKHLLFSLAGALSLVPFRPLVALASCLALITLLVVGPPAAAAAISSVVGSKAWSGGPGVAVCFPSDGGTCIDTSTDQVVVPAESPSYGWQCAELAVRFWDSMGWEHGWFGGNGVDFYSWGQSHPSVATVYPNGDGYMPVHGDLIVVADSGSGGEPGHVAVVDYTDDAKNVHVKEQNNSRTGQATYGFSGGSLSRQGDARRILGVVHANANIYGSISDLRGVDMNQTGSGRTEVHILSAASNYQQFTNHVATSLEATSPDKWAFSWASNGDLFGIAMNQTGSGRTEVHVLSADSDYQQFSNHVATALEATAPSDWTFQVAPNRDLVAIRMHGSASGRTEVHVLSAASDYQQFTNHVATALNTVNANQWEFRLTSQGDIVGVNLNGTGSGRTEVHTLSAASNYQQFSQHIATALELTDRTQWEFQLAANGDVLGIKLNGTASGRTEVHTLSASSNYQQFSLHDATALAQVLPGIWNFGVGSFASPSNGCTTCR